MMMTHQMTNLAKLAKLAQQQSFKTTGKFILKAIFYYYFNFHLLQNLIKMFHNIHYILFLFCFHLMLITSLIFRKTNK